MTREQHIADMKARAVVMATQAQPSHKSHVGTQGQREEFTGTVKYIKDFMVKIDGQDDAEQERHLTILETEGGNVIKYWNLFRYHPKGQNKVEIGQGVKISFRATVASHEEYKGEKQTLVQRAHVTKVLE